MRLNLFCSIAVVLVCLLAAPPAVAQDIPRLQSRVVPLNPEDKNQETVGRLRWRGGLAISATTGRFGGFSDLLLSADGGQFTSISDEGRWLTGRLAYDRKGDLAGISATGFGRLRDLDGKPLKGKQRQDAESLSRLADGSLIIGFERDHRLWRLPASRSLQAEPTPFPLPPGMSGADPNAGIEALVTLADGRLLAFTEGQRQGDNYAVYLWEPKNGWGRLALRPNGLFRPTGAARLPDGDVMLLERRFTLLGGVGIQLRRLAASSIRNGAVLEGEKIAELRAPLSVDNFEGIAVHDPGDGGLRLTLISDDNFSPLQRTLIVQFELLSEDRDP